MIGVSITISTYYNSNNNIYSRSASPDIVLVPVGTYTRTGTLMMVAVVVIAAAVLELTMSYTVTSYVPSGTVAVVDVLSPSLYIVMFC